MIGVFHFDTYRDPDIYFDINERTEKKIVNNLSKDWNVTRCSAEEWFGQDNPKYSIHHWNVSKKRNK